MSGIDYIDVWLVALLAEGVDRNSEDDGALIARLNVALLAEGVDRNSEDDGALIARLNVALLAEGVDRNWASIAT